MRYLITFSYDGTSYHGYERQVGYKTIEEELNKALTYINNKKTKIVSSGRTDKGVHAIYQTGHADIDVKITEYKLKRAMNSLLPNDIHVISTKIVDNNFHARFNVKKKIYQYKINIGDYDPLKNNYFYQLNYKLDIKKLNEAAKLFLGVHNFKNFVSGERDNYEAIIYNVNVENDDNTIIITFEGKSFYRYMVRNMVGAMLDVATNKNTLDELKEMLDNVEVSKQMCCAPAQGLYLMKIIY